ncbi:uncharacterized protein LOC108095292 [Drosophila ficusphila]|uniref:uncharacterized protein LOC108095292 n=1 Tax=Drosophila ficusphila TaxID=30025 RepID=UPI0007E6E549|nr:uncharacterized protein LOC108095292 [Drosophila ficusphila]
MKLRCAVAVFLVLLSVLQVQAVLWPEQHPLEERLSVTISGTLKNILANAMSTFKFSVFISTAFEKMDRNRVNLVHRVLDQSLRHPKTPVPIILASQLPRRLNTPAAIQLLFVQNAQEAVSAASQLEHNNPCIIVLLLFPPKDSEARVIMSRIFRYFMEERYNINVLVLVPDLEEVRAFNVWPYTPKSCMNLEPVEVDIKEAGLFDIFPRRLKNLHGCPLSVIVWDIPPYMKVHWDREDPLRRLEGLDGKLIRLMAGKMNFTIELVPNEPAGLIGGASFLNGTQTGAYKMLLERRANLTIGCAACTPERATFLAATGPYSQMPYVLVMRARGGYSIYEIMLFPYAESTWLLLFVILCIHILLNRCFRMPSPVLAGWLLWTFIVRASYEASVFNFIHNSPVKPSPRTLQSTLDNGYQFITDHATYRMTLKLPSFTGRTTISPGQPVDVFDALLKSPWGTAAFTSRAFLADHLVKHREHRNRLVILAEKILDNMLCIYFPHGSYFAWEFNMPLFNLRSFGIFQHHAEVLAWKSMPTTTDSTDKSVHSSDLDKGFAESMGFVLAAFNCLMAALGLSIGVFLLELLSRRRRWSRLAYVMERL